MHAGVFAALLSDIIEGAFAVEDLLQQDYVRVRELCDRYEDADIGFVDGSLVAIPKRLGEPKLATLDRRHFGIIRPRHVDAFRLLPG
jgi:predicted nucleic acid-binding protein